MSKFVKYIILTSFGTVLALWAIKFSGQLFNKQPKEVILRKLIPAGATFAKFAGELGLSTSTANAVFEASKGKYDLSTIIEGRELALVFSVLPENYSDPLKKIVYKINNDDELIIEKDQFSTWQAATRTIPYEIKEKKAAGVIESSLYETIIASGIDERLALALAEIFAWQIDFAADIQKGDNFKVIYEERFLDGEYIMPGKILAAEFINNSKTFRGYYFEGSQAKANYYDDDGNSLQKQFLKSPLQYKYISSGFSYARFNPITKKVSPHRGIDYAANAGTPAVAVGDGTVVQAGWNGYYGISVTVRHNDTYKTVYGHFSSVAKGIRVGVKIKQGQVVGYVGSTGLATGPHLHYEMHKFGNYVNPFLVEIPPGEPIAEADKAVFEQQKISLSNKLTK